MAVLVITGHHMKEVNIWVAVGLLQLVYGVILLVAGVRQFWAPSATVLANLHATFWAGIILIAFGLLVILMNRLNRIDGRPNRP
jgi:hypothetical protein